MTTVSRTFAVATAAFVAVASTALTAIEAAAAPTLIKSFAKANDCHKIGLDDCYISQSGITTEGPSGDKSSPAIGKRNEVGGTGGNLLFPLSGYEAGLEAVGSTFTIAFNSTTKVLTWTYTGTHEIHYVVYKQASGYHVFYDAVAFTTHTIDLDAPLVIGSTTSGIGADSVSHITWFNTGGGGPGGTGVPVPATLALFGIGLLGLAGLRRYAR